LRSSAFAAAAAQKLSYTSSTFWQTTEKEEAETTVFVCL